MCTETNKEACQGHEKLCKNAIRTIFGYLGTIVWKTNVGDILCTSLCLGAKNELTTITQTQKIIEIFWTCFQVYGQTEHSQVKGYTLYLVRAARCIVEWVDKQLKQLQEIAIISALYSAIYQFSTLCCESNESMAIIHLDQRHTTSLISIFNLIMKYTIGSIGLDWIKDVRFPSQDFK